ncbi:MAG: ankyrin repeat domain-containing protein [Gammaproteobacteria bacterium]
MDNELAQKMGHVLDVPADGGCLFYAVALGVLFLSLGDETAFGETCKELFGASSLSTEEQTALRVYLQVYQSAGSSLLTGNVPLEHKVRDLIKVTWRNKLVDYMVTLKNTLGETSPYYQALAAEADDRGITIEVYFNRMRDPIAWGGEPEILAMCHYLGHPIEVYEDESSKKPNCYEVSDCEGASPLRLRYCSQDGGSNKNHYQLLLQPLGPEVVLPSVMAFNDQKKMATFYQQIFKNTLKPHVESKLSPTRFFKNQADIISQHSSLVKNNSSNNNPPLTLEEAIDRGDIEWVKQLLAIDKTLLEKSNGQQQQTPFLYAAKKGQLAILQVLKESGANVHAVDAYGNNALHRAVVLADDVLTVMWLLTLEGFDIESRAQGGETAFLYAAAKGQLKMLRLLKASGANIHVVDNDGHNALHVASLLSNDVSTVAWLLDLEAYEIESRSQDGWTPFLCAVQNGQLEVLALLQERGVDIHVVDDYGHNALHVASLSSGNVSTVAWLLQLKTYDIESQAQHGRTAFLCAAQSGQLEVLQLLEASGANIHAVDDYGNNALHLALAVSDNVPMMMWLLALESYNIESCGQYRRTAFLYAAQSGQLEVLRLLKASGANIHAVDDHGNNALHLASMCSGNVSTIAWLLELKEWDLESRNGYGDTAFLYAARNGQLEVLRLLREKGADIYAVNRSLNNALHLASSFSGDVLTVAWLLGLEAYDIESRAQGGETAFLYAAVKGQLEVLRLLKERGANIHALDNYGNNALHLALLFLGDVSTVMWLLELDVFDIESRAQGGQTPFLFAAQQGQLELLKLLRKKGADIHTVDEGSNNALHLASLYSSDVLAVAWLLGLEEYDIESRSYCNRTTFLLAADMGNLEVLRLLKERGANIHALDEDGNNALYLASSFSGDVPTVTWLLELEGFGIESRDECGRTAFLCAAAQGQLAVLNKLYELGADIKAVDNNGNNALHYAALYSNDVATVTWLLGLGELNIESRGYGGKTAFLYAALQGHLDILKVLKDLGANIDAIDNSGNNALSYILLHAADSDDIIDSDVIIDWLHAREGVDEQSDGHDENEQQGYFFCM